VRVTHAGGEESFDQVVFACHADQALAVLKTPSAAEHDILQHFPYRPSTAILHRDAAQMPKNRAAWTSWNYLGAANDPRGDAAQVSVTYWMNRLQTIDVKYPLFVSVNPLTPVAKDKIFETIAYEHPQFSAASFRAQERLHMIEGADRIWYCGAWCGFGFHEDGLISGWEVAERLGAHIDWPKGVRRRLFRTAA
ncbi:MAG TPA: NAD/FAD-binding protein, partial [Alphaproteobacteria bacterium]|nr:NAD/FAD-binding protein [Alphaproteobacteria bacterium]